MSLWHLQLCPDVLQAFTRWGLVEWWQPVSIRLFQAGATCCHSPGASPKGLQPRFETPAENTCRPNGSVSIALQRSGYELQHRGALTVGSLPLKAQKEVKEEHGWECGSSAWTALCPPPPSASAAARAAVSDRTVHSAATRENEVLQHAERLVRWFMWCRGAKTNIYFCDRVEETFPELPWFQVRCLEQIIAHLHFVEIVF